jgi:oligoendopeptidase F
MTLPPLPDNVDDFDGANWDVVGPYFEDLRARPLTPENTEAWLMDWSHLEALLSDTYTKLMVAYHLDTASVEKQAAAEKYITDIYPRAMEAEQPLKQKLIESGYNAPQHAVLLRRFRNEFEIYRDENVPLLAELEQLSMQYQKIMGAMTVQFDAKELTVQQLRPYQLKTDRGLRERAWRAGRERQMQDREQLHDLFDQMLKLRHQIALNAGFENYRDYMFRSMGRFDYTPADCKAFHAAIEQVVVPAVQRRMARRKEAMGLAQLRLDTAVDPQAASR